MCCTFHFPPLLLGKGRRVRSRSPRYVGQSATRYFFDGKKVTKKPPGVQNSLARLGQTVEPPDPPKAN